MRLSMITWVGPKSNNKCPHKRKEEGGLPQGEEGHGKAKAEAEVMHLQNEGSKDCRQAPELGEGAWAGFSLGVPRGRQPCQHPSFRLLVSRTVRE